MRNHHGFRKFTFESLESRRLLAGDINTTEVNGVLSIYGDRFDNAIAVRSSSDGVIELIGLNRSGQPTTINGHASELLPGITSIIFEFDDARDSINTGNDAVVITDLTFNGPVKIHMGDGNDIVGLGQFDNSAALVDAAVNSLLGPISIQGGLSIELEGGNHTVLAQNVTLSGQNGSNLVITSGNGNDTVQLKTVSVARGTIITTGGAVQLEIDGLTSGALSLSLGVGNDQVSLKNASLGSFSVTASFGNDVIALDHVGAGSLVAILGRGNDQFSLNSVVVSLESAVDTAEGNDAVTFDTVTLHPLALATGAGNDEISISNAEMGITRINAGEGANVIGLSTVGARKTLKMVGGAGVDKFTLTTVTVAKELIIEVGAGNDIVNLSTVTANSLTLALGAGNDKTSFTAVRIAGASLIYGGLGNDGVVLSDLRSKSLDVMLSDGRDHVSVHKVRVTKKTMIGGGNGTDKYMNFGENSLAGLTRPRIETFDTGSTATTG